MTLPRVLTIAGSDSGGGAGIQADLKAFAACRVHGMTAITAITAQNTIGVDVIEAVSPELILAQVRAVARDIGVDAVKVGMLGSTETIDAVAAALAELRAENPALPIVVDPVMVSESGAELLEPSARDALIRLLVPLATVLSGDTGLPALFIRKEAKAYGTRQLAEGGDPAGRTVLLVEDVITTGGAVRNAALALRASGATVTTVVCAIDRSAPGEDPLGADGIMVRPVLTKALLDSVTSAS